MEDLIEQRLTVEQPEEVADPHQVDVARCAYDAVGCEGQSADQCHRHAGRFERLEKFLDLPAKA